MLGANNLTGKLSSMAAATGEIEGFGSICLFSAATSLANPIMERQSLLIVEDLIHFNDVIIQSHSIAWKSSPTGAREDSS